MSTRASIPSPVGVVCGSGIELTSLLDEITGQYPFESFAGLSCGAVDGHSHRFVTGVCEGHHMVVQCGRLHMYEGFDFAAVTRPVDVLRDFGVRTIVFTNAAGGLRPELQPGDIVGVDSVRLWRYQRWPETPAVLHPDVVLEEVDFHGALQWVPGPSYETRAEVKALQKMKALAVGMSVGPELARCQELGIRAAVLSCITNSCFSGEQLTHKQVLTVAGRTSAKVALLVRNSLSKLD